MGECKFKIGDKVKVKSLEWYHGNMNHKGEFDGGGKEWFVREMKEYCGKVMTIKELTNNESYLLEEDDDWVWEDWMFEGLAESKYNVGDVLTSDVYGVEGEVHKIDIYNGEYRYYLVTAVSGKGEREILCIPEMYVTGRRCTETSYGLPEGYEFVDDKGNVIESSKIIVRKKKAEYPKNYDEACKVLGICDRNYLTIRDWMEKDGEEVTTKYEDELLGKMSCLYSLRIILDAYWKIYGEEIGLGKAWEPDWLDDDVKKWVIGHDGKVFYVNGGLGYVHYLLAFPTKEMAEEFSERFYKEYISNVKQMVI